MMDGRGQIRGFGTLPDGTEVDAVEIAAGGARAVVISYGASLQDFRIAGLDRSLVLGSPDISAYTGPMRFFGAIVGPVANRIAGGRMPVGGKTYDLDRNEVGKTTLHGGATGFSQQNWTFTYVSPVAVTLTLEHPDGQGGFPGPITSQARYTLDTNGVLTIEITGRSDVHTCFAPAFHGLWALGVAADLSACRLTIPAERYLPVDDDLIPLGAPAPVAGTAFDYRTPRVPDLKLDHNFCICETRGTLRPMCRLEVGDYRLDVESTEVGLQVYTAGALDTYPSEGHEGHSYGPGAGIALEPQFWPDTPNHPDYPPSDLAPGETYRQISRFAVTHQTKRPR